MITEDQLEHVAKVFGAIGVIAAATVAAWKKGVMPAFRFASNVADIFDSLQDIKKQLIPNGGSSMRDAIDRIEARLIIAEQRHKLLTMDSPFAVFETSAEGECIHVNRTYCRWTGMAHEELEGKGWVNAITRDCRPAVYHEWEQAVDQVREFTMDYTLADRDGCRFNVRCNAFPMFDAKCKLSGWMGIISKI